MQKSNKKMSTRAKKCEKAHRHRSINGRNTNTVPGKQRRKRARSWCFTLNNYTKEDVNTMTQSRWNDLEIKKFVFQEEKGVNGTPHLQGVVMFKNPTGLAGLKKIHEKIHWEICKNFHASKSYCSKEETRTGMVYTYGIELEKKSSVSDEVIRQEYKKWFIQEIYSQIKDLNLDIDHDIYIPK